MKTRNNFETSSTGINIECTAFYNEDRSRMEFTENFEILRHSGYRASTLAYYINGGNVAGPDAIEFALEGSDKDIEQALFAEGYNRDEVKAMIEGEAFEILEGYYGEKVTLLNYQDFNKVFAPLIAKPSKHLEIVEIRGYSQGDYAQVIYCPDDLRAAWGIEPKDLEDMFTHYFYDSPVYAVVTINGHEYQYDEMPEAKTYEWLRDEFIAWVAKQSGVSADLIAPVVPKNLEY